jgi:uncharacterized protein (DUF3820 family)
MPGNEAGTVNFGKYKGLPVATLFADLDYCKWILNQDWFKRNALYLEVLKLVGEPEVKSSSIYESGSSGISTPGIDTVAFGKYKGQPMATLFADKQYCKWVVGQEWFSRNPVFGRVKAVADTVPAPSAMRGQSPPPDSPPPDSPCSGGGDSDHGEYEPDDD